MEYFRIQPLDIDIPEQNPFQYDLLGRRNQIEALTYLVGSTEGPCVMAVDAPWGAGKSTFLKMWSQYLRNQKYVVVEFNAWETDFSQDPFMALCAELMAAIDEKEVAELSARATQLKKAAQVISQHIAANVMRRLSFDVLDLNAILAKLSEQPPETQIETRLKEYLEVKKAFTTFRQTLQDMAAEMSKYRPLIVMIDELDRCRPTYAVELLETAKHLFAVDQVVFVLAVNSSELQHAVKTIYGDEFEAEAYLRRFIDLDLNLPRPNLGNFIDNLFLSMGLKDNYWYEKLLKPFFSTSSLTLRDIAQAVHRLGLVLNSLPELNDVTARMTAVALLMRIFNEPIYHQFAKGEVSDLEVADHIFDIPSITHLRWTEEGIIFQTGISKAYRQMINNLGKTKLELEIQRRIDEEGDERAKGTLLSADSIATNALADENPTTPIFRSAYEHTELMFSLSDEKSDTLPVK